MLGLYLVMKSVRAFPWVLLVGALLFLGITYVREALLADSCLDSGGSFDYLRMTCDRELSHTFIPYYQRHGALFAIAVIATLVAAFYLIISGRKARTE